MRARLIPDQPDKPDQPGKSEKAQPDRRARAAASLAKTSTPRGVLSNAAMLVIIVAVLAVFAVVVTFAVRSTGSGPTAASGGVSPADAASAQVVRDNSRRLSEVPDAKATFVEFLDFECEACRAAYPTVEQLRQQYAGQVTFVVRYFPIDSHFNAMRAARAVEAAAQQGQLEAMYKKMYTTQQQWSEQQVAQDDTFRGFAQDLGLDMTKWDAAYNDAATTDRINLDVADGKALGVEGTPTFFINGQRIQPKSPDELSDALDQALGR